MTPAARLPIGPCSVSACSRFQAVMQPTVYDRVDEKSQQAGREPIGKLIRDRCIDAYCVFWIVFVFIDKTGEKNFKELERFKYDRLEDRMERSLLSHFSGDATNAIGPSA